MNRVIPAFPPDAAVSTHVPFFGRVPIVQCAPGKFSVERRDVRWNKIACHGEEIMRVTILGMAIGTFLHVV